MVLTLEKNNVVGRYADCVVRRRPMRVDHDVTAKLFQYTNSCVAPQLKVHVSLSWSFPFYRLCPGLLLAGLCFGCSQENTHKELAKFLVVEISFIWHSSSVKTGIQSNIRVNDDGRLPSYCSLTGCRSGKLTGPAYDSQMN